MPLCVRACIFILESGLGGWDASFCQLLVDHPPGELVASGIAIRLLRRWPEVLIRARIPSLQLHLVQLEKKDSGLTMCACCNSVRCQVRVCHC